MTDVVVVALGARTPVGLTAESSAAAVRAGISRVGEHPFMVDVAGDPLMAAIDARLDSALLGWERIAPLAVGALEEALGVALPDPAHSPVLSVLLSLPDSRPGFSSEDARRVMRRLDEALQSRTIRARVEAGGTGHAGALHGIALAVAQLRAGRCDIAAVGGADSYFEADTLQALAADKRLAAQGVRAGFHPGEGAAFVVLALAEVAQRLGLTPLAVVRGAAFATEANPIAAGVEVLGAGLASAISEAAADLKLPDEAIQSIFCDINGERYRTTEWGMTFLRLGAVFSTTAYEAPANLWGDVGAAWGALGCVLATRSWARQYAKGPLAIVCGSSDAGLRAAVVLERR